jgi:hypothetical protein
MTVEGLLDLYQGQVVPKAYNAGYVALSYLISLVGAASTLELINRRSWFNGISNQYAQCPISQMHKYFQKRSTNTEALVSYLGALQSLWVV